MKLALQLCCYNGARYLPYLFASLNQQTFKNWHLTVLDNASDPDQALAIKEALSALPQDRVELFHTSPNIGFAGGHAFLYERRPQEAQYLGLLNDDAILEPTYLEELVRELDIHAECGAVEGVVYRWDYDAREEADQGKTAVLDTYGLHRDRYGRIFDRGANREFARADLPERSFPVWGVSGCLPVYRVQAIRECTLGNTLFDKQLRIYKEDVDLAWSMQHAGWTARTVPQAIAYHRRSYGAKITSLKRPTTEAGALSYRNHLWNTFVHSTWKDLLRHPGTVPFEALKSLYWAVRHPKTLVEAARDTWKNRSWLKQKRTFMQYLSVVHANGDRPISPPPSRTTKIAVVMVTHNDVSEDCLQSIAAARRATPNLEITLVVADNNSKQDTAHIVQRIIPDATVLLRNDDHGYGRSCNRAAQDIRADYYFILNPDTILTQPDIFARLLASAEQHPEAGIIGPQIFYFDGRLQETCRRFPRWYMPLVQRSSLGKTAWGKRYADQFLMLDVPRTSAQHVDWIQGSAMFLRSEMWHLLGGFDDHYWLYFEDTDLCRRSLLAGMPVLYDPTIQLKHAHGKTSAKHRSMLMNLFLVKEARGHLISWIKYTWKWLFV